MNSKRLPLSTKVTTPCMSHKGTSSERITFCKKTYPYHIIEHQTIQFIKLSCYAGNPVIL